MPTADRTLDPDALICCCWQVSVAGIELAIDNGERSLSALANGCRAGSGCGSCRGQVLRILRRKLATPASPASIANQTAVDDNDDTVRSPGPVQPSLFDLDS